MDTKAEILIFSGFNQRAVISFCRFCKINNIKFNVVASGVSDTILKTSYKENIIHIRKTLQFSIEEFKLYRSTITAEKVLILPSTEYLNRYLLEQRSEIEELGFLIPLCKKSLYEEISDKYAFGNLCRNYEINVPGEFGFPNKFETPFVAKPKKYFSQQGKIHKPVLILRDNDYLEFRQTHNIEDFYYQEFIGGRSYYLLFYFFSNNNDCSVYSQENLIQQFDGRSIVAAESSDIHKNTITSKFINLFNESKFSGLVMIEIKFYREKFFMIEANPRLWGPSQLILDSNMDLFHNFLSDYGFLHTAFKLDYRLHVKYFWSGGIIEDHSNERLIAFHNYSESKFFIDYPALLQNEVYARSDTFEIYKEENKLK